MPTRAIVVGSGLAGLACALTLADHGRDVVLMTKTTALPGGSSPLAQGGIAAAIGSDDAPSCHARDTVAVGGGLCADGAVTALTTAAPEAIEALRGLGVAFDRTPEGGIALGREAAHSHPRIVHAQGDRTGHVVIEALTAAALRHPRITVLTRTMAARLVTRDGRVTGVLAHQDPTGWQRYDAPAVVLATGGIGALFAHTTNPAEATGDGLALAARAGAALADLEFVQFHPTALRGDGARRPLLTEALRGAGARLVLGNGRPLIGDRHPQGDLAPRDAIARFIHEALVAEQPVFLDLRPALEARPGAFPQALETCRAAGLDPFVDPVPVVPAAHYHMGGVVIDDQGRTSLDGLWACGETATSGIHGANRLASNSLLEAFVFGRRAALDIVLTAPALVPVAAVEPPPLPAVPADADWAVLRDTMSCECGLVRDAAGLARAARRIDTLTGSGKRVPGTTGDIHRAIEFDNARLVARMVVAAAAARTESRGAHARADYPATEPAWCCRQIATLHDDVVALACRPVHPELQAAE